MKKQISLSVLLLLVLCLCTQAYAADTDDCAQLYIDNAAGILPIRARTDAWYGFALATDSDMTDFVDETYTFSCDENLGRITEWRNGTGTDSEKSYISFRWDTSGIMPMEKGRLYAEKDGKKYVIDVLILFPEIAMYSRPEVSLDAFIPDTNGSFMVEYVGGQGKTVYLCSSTPNFQFRSVTVSGEGITAQVSQDGLTYIEVTLEPGVTGNKIATLAAVIDFRGGASTFTSTLKVYFQDLTWEEFPTAESLAVPAEPVHVKCNFSPYQYRGEGVSRYTIAEECGIALREAILDANRDNPRIDPDSFFLRIDGPYPSEDYYYTMGETLPLLTYVTISGEADVVFGTNRKKTDLFTVYYEFVPGPYFLSDEISFEDLCLCSNCQIYHMNYLEGENADPIVLSAPAVDAKGDPIRETIEYQWYIFDEYDPDNNVIPGADKKTFTIPTEQTGSFAYWVTATVRDGELTDTITTEQITVDIFGDTVSYPAEGGNIYFNPDTFMIVHADRDITRAEIPNEIDGMPVLEIRENAFFHCEKLEALDIAAGFRFGEVGLSAFDGCTSLSDIYFEGSPSEWREVQIRYGNDPLLNAAMHYGRVTNGVFGPENSYSWSYTVQDHEISVYSQNWDDTALLLGVCYDENGRLLSIDRLTSSFIVKENASLIKIYCLTAEGKPTGPCAVITPIKADI